MTDETRTAGAANGAADSLLGEVADDFLRRRERGERPDPEEYAARHPHVAGLIRRTLRALRLVESAGGASPGGEGRPAAGPGEPLGDFRILREVGRGGMGVVYEAEQLSLRRRVALKVLPFGAVMDPRALQRFRNEALAAATLDHPHVVKVYAVGCDRGVHHIALQFVEGQTLADLIADRKRPAGPAARPTPPVAVDETRTHAPARADDPTGDYRPPPPPTSPAAAATTSRASVDAAYARRVAEWGAQAAEALEHAHALGVVHRDVKPGNLLVDGRGHLWVADFGLARVAADPGVTHTGDVLGTPRYMSLEQAGARHNLVDHRTDVYALGATLYELLTLEPAVPGRDKHEVLRNIAFADPVPPRKLDRRVPADLDTIVLKCLEKDPARRYATAQDLADDLKRFLARTPIRARRATVPQRLGKWAARHRGLVGAGAAVLAFVAVLSAAGAAVIWDQSRAREQALADRTAALEERTAALAAAERRLGLTRQAADDMYTQVAEEWLADQPRLQPKQREFLQKAQALYEVLAREGGDAPAARLDAARAALKLGRIEHALGRRDAAEAANRTAIRLLESLPGDAPDAETLTNLSTAYCGLGEMLRRAGRAAEAAAAFRDAETYVRRLRERFPADPAGPRYLASIANNRAVLAITAGRPGDAIGDLRESLRVYASFVGPTSPPRDRRAEIESFVNLAQAVSHLPGGRKEAIALARRGAELADRLAADYPSRPAYQAKRGETRLVLGTVLDKTDRDGVAVLSEAIRAFEKLVENYPDVPDYRDSLGGCYNNLGDLLVAAGSRSSDGLDADGACRRAVAIFEKLAADFPTDAEFRRRYPDALQQHIGILHQTGKSVEDIFPLYRRHVEARLRLAADFPEVAKHRDDAARSAFILVCNLIPEVPGNPAARDEALKLNAAAIELRHTHLGYRQQRGEIYAEAGQWAEAVAALEEYFRMGGTYPAVEFLLSVCYSRLGEAEKARRAFDRAAARVPGKYEKDRKVAHIRAEAARSLAGPPAREAAPPPRPVR